MDFGSSFITGIHCSVVEALRKHYGLDPRPVKIAEPYQMLGQVEPDLLDAMGLDVRPVFPHRTIFGFPNEDWKTWTTPWGQTVQVSTHFKTKTDAKGNTFIFPQGDINAPPSGMMPATGYFFDTIERIDPDFDEDNLRVEDNLEEFGLMSPGEERYWKTQLETLKNEDRAVMTHLNGTCLGDIALVPAPFLKNPKGVRGVADWYMLTATNPEHVKAIFEKQTAIAVANMEKLYAIAGNQIDIVVVCGTDFGTQNSLFCGESTVRDIWLPYYRQINDWIHRHTEWKTFKHSCGAIKPLIETFIDCGFDILNPVQCSATGMDPAELKREFGSAITFWGGGVNTQETLPFGTPESVRREVLERCEIFACGGGFVFNAIHNVQALTPIANMVAMIDAVHEFNGQTQPT